MRASLPHTLRARRRTRDDQHEREPATIGYSLDHDVQRVRSAGGPIDRASYACPCGFMFLAPVSTTVVCPHCHSPQAW